jgi:calcium-dependent protein kinase
LKPENVLVSSQDTLDKALVKITDFGISCQFKPGQVLKARVGTMAFMAPEVIQKRYDPQCDIWSTGVMLFFLLCGGLPFLGKDKEEVYAKIQAGKFQYSDPAWVDVSQETLDFIKELIVVNPKHRLQPKDALKHKFFKKHRPRTPEVELKPIIFKNLVSFKGENRFKRAVFCIIASLLPKEQVQYCYDCWATLDHDGDGILHITEVKHYLNTMIADKKLPQSDSLAAKKILREVEAKGFTNCTYTEFVAATFDRKKHLQESVCRAAFTAFDQDCNGTITLEELSSGSLLGNMSLSELGKLVNDVDTNGDGEIDFDEFFTMMRAGPKH